MVSTLERLTDNSVIGVRSPRNTGTPAKNRVTSPKTRDSRARRQFCVNDRVILPTVGGEFHTITDTSVSHAAETVTSEVRVTSTRTEVALPNQCAAVFTTNSTEPSRRSAAIVQNARERRVRGL